MGNISNVLWRVREKHAKEHLSEFNSNKDYIRKELAFFKHLENSHGARDERKQFIGTTKMVIQKEQTSSGSRRGKQAREKYSKQGRYQGREQEPSKGPG